MKHSIKIGFSFGITSGIITTLGLMVGLEAGTSSRLAVIGGVLTIAIADAFSDSLGIHISEEADNKNSSKEVWLATISTFLTKAFFASLFIIPIIFLELSTAIIFSVIFGLVMIAIFSYIIAKHKESNPWNIVGEHLLIATCVIIITHFLGIWISNTFN